MKIPKPLANLLLIANALLSILGLSSIAEGFVVWSGFFRQALNVYSKYFRGSVAYVVEKIKPDFVPPIPAFVYDVIIIWS